MVIIYRWYNFLYEILNDKLEKEFIRIMRDYLK